MDTVYKYCGEYGLAILSNLELKVTPPNQFNDPFEFTPKMVCSDMVRYVKSERVCKWWYETARSEKGFSGSFPEFKVKYLERLGVEKNISQITQGMDQVMQITLPLSEKEFLDEVSKRFGVLCMSGRRDEILMWGHYCDKPLGLVIGFDKSSAIFQQGKGLRPVTYVQNRVVYDACWEEGAPELLKKYEDQIIYYKSIAWKYEDELRQFFPLTSSSLIKKPLKKTLSYFLSLPPEAIVSVTLGPRCSPELDNKVRKILQKPCFSLVKLDRAVLHKDDFVLEFEAILHR